MIRIQDVITVRPWFAKLLKTFASPQTETNAIKATLYQRNVFSDSSKIIASIE